MTDLDKLIALVREVADDPTTTYKPRRTLSAAKSNAAYKLRRARD